MFPHRTRLLETFRRNRDEAMAQTATATEYGRKQLISYIAAMEKMIAALEQEHANED